METVKISDEFELKLQDFSEIQSDGIVDIIPIDPKRFEEVSFSQFKPANQSTTFGVPREIYLDKAGQKRVRFKRIKITGYTTYDCTIREQAIEYSVVKNHPIMEGSPFQRDKPLLRIYNRESEAKVKYSTIMESLDALKIAANMGEEELTDFSRNLGCSPEVQSYKVLRCKVAEFAQKEPTKFISEYESSNRGIFTVIKRSEGIGLLSHDPEKGYLWKRGFRLGHTFSAMILTLQKDKELLSTMDYESKEKSKFTYVKEKIVSNDTSENKEKSIEIEKYSDYKKKNENLNTQKEEVKEVKTGIPVNRESNAMNSADFAVATDENEVNERRKIVIRAKELKIVHAGVKSTKTLNREIEEILKDKAQ